MAKLNPFGLAPLERIAETRSFYDEVAGQELTFTLRYANTPEQSRASEIAQELIRDYLTGDETRAAGPFPAPDVLPSETLFRTAALLSVMQCPENPADAYSPTELCVLSVRAPLAWAQLIPWYLATARGGKDAWEKKSPEAPTASSAVPRFSTPESIPSSPTAATISSA